MSIKVGELKKLLDQFDDNLPIFYKFQPTIGTIGEVFYIYKSQYGFFGKSLPCIVLDSEEGIENE